MSDAKGRAVGSLGCGCSWGGGAELGLCRGAGGLGGGRAGEAVGSTVGAGEETADGLTGQASLPPTTRTAGPRSSLQRRGCHRVGPGLGGSR